MQKIPYDCEWTQWCRLKRVWTNFMEKIQIQSNHRKMEEIMFSKAHRYDAPTEQRQTNLYFFQKIDSDGSFNSKTCFKWETFSWKKNKAKYTFRFSSGLLYYVNLIFLYIKNLTIRFVSFSNLFFLLYGCMCHKTFHLHEIKFKIP